MTEEDSLDAAWAALAGQVEIGAVALVYIGDDDAIGTEARKWAAENRWKAIVSESGWLGEGLIDQPAASGPTPAAALWALVAELRSGKG